MENIFQKHLNQVPHDLRPEVYPKALLVLEILKKPCDHDLHM